MKKIAIEFKNVNKSFGHKTVLNNINFKIYEGQFHGFIGANGAGKTTSFRSLLGFYPSVTGEIEILGQSFKDQESKRKIGYIPEEATFPKKLKVFEYLEMMAQLSGLSVEQGKLKVQELSKNHNLSEEILKKSGINLSSGEKKKVLLIQSLLNDPEILILDEPAANLDPKIRIELYEILKDLNKKGKTIFISSHILAELEKYIDSYTVIEKGKIYETKTIQEKTSEKEYSYYIKSPEIWIVEDSLKLFNKNYHVEYQIKDNIIHLKCDDLLFNKLLLYLLKKEIKIDSSGKQSVNLNDLYFDVLKAE
ncbi:ABC transporter ATP-binding protein [Mycoplasmopsis alligatoris]|uniref:ABC transporter, ATP-binding protein n=1 Tax=Mycoplasmopsis alligatoris A21JP2 TaxID=747682 RepID=D4XWB5_9BACT|nr:ABC transporter ATP-binding protein [Mycoplasmopsis alligatoris]EFF41218.1 ABC transporter, ATP-binding protein [Mycoplasmopsis alligatoris A21JP2]